MKKLKLLLAACALMVWGAGSANAQETAPFLIEKNDFSGTAVSQLSTFVPNGTTYTLELTGCVAGSEITVLGGSFSYTPTASGTVRFVRNGGDVVYVYEGTTYKGTVTVSNPADPTYPTGLTSASTENLIQNGGFEDTSAGTYTTNRWKPTHWTPYKSDKKDPNDNGVSVRNGSPITGTYAMMMHDKGIYLTQQLSSGVMKNFTAYQITYKYKANNDGQKGQKYRFQVGSEEFKTDYFNSSETNATTTSVQDFSATFTTPASVVDQPFIQIFRSANGSGNQHLDFVDEFILVAANGGGIGITGATGATFVSGSAYAPEGVLAAALTDGPIDATSRVTNPTFDSNLNGWNSPIGGGSEIKVADNRQDETRNFYQTWNGTPKDGRMYQVIENLPQGTYELELIAFADQGGSMTPTSTAVAVYAQGQEVGTTSSSYIRPNYVNSTNFLSYKAYAYVDATGKLEIGMRQYKPAQFKWLGMDNVSLKYIATDNQEETKMMEMYQAKWAAVGGILTDENYTVVTGKERADLSEKLQATISAYSDYKTAADGANAACLAFMNAKDSYAAYATAKAAASDVTEADVLAVVIAGNSEATAANALAASVILPKAEALKDATAAVPITTDFVVNGTFDSNVDGWTCTGGFQNSQLKDATSGTLNKFWENWTSSENAAANKMYQTINNVPNGTYRLNISAFANNVDGSTQYVFANNDKTSLTAAANPGADYEVYTVVTDNTLEIGLEQTEATANWMGIDNVSLNYFGTGNKIEAAKNAAHKIYWDEALAAATAAKNDAAYQNVTGNELTNLITEIGKTEPNNADGYDAATEALKAATLAFTNAKDSYDAFVTAAEVEYTEDTEKFPYASHAKFEAIATAQNAKPTSVEDAVTKTTAIISAYRKYVESNALAEGVEGATSITIQDPNMEVTYNSTSHTFGAWQVFGQVDGTIRLLSDESFTDGDGKNDYKYADIWKSDNNAGIKQTISDLPAGKYLLTVTARANTTNDATFYVFAGSTTAPIQRISNSGGVFDRGWNDASVEFEVTKRGDVEIGVQSGNGKDLWWSATRFRLVRLETTPIAETSDYSALKDAISDAEGYALGFDEGQYAPYNNVTALQALADAQAIKQDEENSKSKVNELTATLNGATWTANTEEVNAIHNGNFATAENLGWNFSAWGEFVSGLNTNTNASNGTARSSNAGKLTYGNTAGYTMPLKANTYYRLNFKVSSWDNDNKNTGTDVSVLNSASEGLTTKNFDASGTNRDQYGAFKTYTTIFKTGEAGDYTLVITAKGGRSVYTDIVLIKAVEAVTVTAAGYATYVSEYDLDFTDTNIKAYTAKVSSGKVVLTQIEKVPAGTPVVLYCEGGVTEGVPLATSTDTAEDNDLLAGTGAAVATTDGDYTNYILNNVNNEIGFYKANGQKVAANRAYLHVSNSEIPTTARLTIVFEDATGITSIVNSDGVNCEKIYNLNGQRVTTPKRGLYIVGGKKVLKK